ncbi:kelch domain-containing protein 2-like [Halichondria panicea]|uniref:kelch domain-containing protein 2-like n=1 Tax=Halichondria panicea TaxID=6063 RepID=UPI00312BA79C
MLKAVRSFLGQLPVEPSPRWGQFSAVDRHHYVWRGDGPRRRCNIIAVYNPSTELWSLLPTTGPLPPGEYGGCSVCAGRCLYTFGGDWDGSSYFNDMSKLDLDTLQWTKVQTFGSQPMKKRGCGLLRVNERTLCCFGGEGIEGSTQPGSTFTSALSDGRGRTNEFHFFDTQNGVWSSPELRGERPPPCSSFTFTMVDQHRAVLFGGYQPGRDDRVNEVYLFDFRTMEVTKVKPVQGEPWPVVRAGHAACCLNYGQDHPQLLVYGGLDNSNKTLGDMWLLDVDTVKWTEVTPPESMTPRFLHSITATSLGPGLTEVLVFGGLRKVGGDAIAETTILRFEREIPTQRALLFLKS